MTDYTILEQHYTPSRIQYALSIARGAARYYPEGYWTPEFEPHLWIVLAICSALGDEYIYDK